MRNTAILAGFALVLLPACAAQPARPAKPAPALASSPAAAAAPTCPLLPVSEYLWEVYRKDVLEAKIESDYSEWLYPAYVGIASLSWAGGAPFFPMVDVFLAPLRIVEPCQRVR